MLRHFGRLSAGRLSNRPSHSNLRNGRELVPVGTGLDPSAYAISRDPSLLSTMLRFPYKASQQGSDRRFSHAFLLDKSEHLFYYSVDDSRTLTTMRPNFSPCRINARVPHGMNIRARPLPVVLGLKIFVFNFFSKRIRIPKPPAVASRVRPTPTAVPESPYSFLKRIPVLGWAKQKGGHSGPPLRVRAVLRHFGKLSAGRFSNRRQAQPAGVP